MKVMLLADPYSAHIIKWANGLYRKGIEVSIFGLSEYHPEEYDSGIKIRLFKVPQFIKWRTDGSVLKSTYILSLPKLRRFIREIRPDILHAHTASSYGMLGAYSGFHPFIISVWGNDVFNFPRKGKFFRNLLISNLSKADCILSTSHFMAAETKNYTPKQIDVVPFGIDPYIFTPKEFSRKDIVIGTIKSMEHKYGVLELMKAFNIVKTKHPDMPLKLLLVGRGSLIDRLKTLAKELNIHEITEITGFIGYNNVPEYHNKIDIAVFPSTEESETFGVAVLEASACEKPVIVSCIGGLREVVEDNVTGMLVPPQDINKLADAIEKLVLDKNLRIKLGTAGRQRVISKFNFNDNLDTMIAVYNKVLNGG